MAKIEELIIEAQRKKRPVYVFGTGYTARTDGYRMLSNLGIKPVAFFDNNIDRVGHEVIDGIYCKSLSGLNMDGIWFILISNVLALEVKKQLYKMQVKDIVMYNDLCTLYSKNYFEFQNKNQIAVYSCIVGGYDEIVDPISIDTRCDYYMITDEKKNKDNVYTYINVDEIVPRNIIDDTRKNRYCKINPHRIFEKYRYSIYFDGCARLKNTITDKLLELPRSRITMLTIMETNVYSQTYKNIMHGRDEDDVFMKQIEKYWMEGLPDTFGVFHPGVILREHNNPICRRIMDTWWDELEHYSYRDMISLPYALWFNGYSTDDVGTLIDRDDIWNDYWGVWSSEHKKARKLR